MQYEDMVAMGYGSYDFLKPVAGLVCVFSLANPTYPEASLPTASGVLCLDFHPQFPHLLAVGCYDGTVLVFDVAKPPAQALLYQSSVEAGTHTEPVWQARPLLLPLRCLLGVTVEPICCRGRKRQCCIRGCGATWVIMHCHEVHNRIAKV